jgi:hypothetical protein
MFASIRPITPCYTTTFPSHERIPSSEVRDGSSPQFQFWVLWNETEKEIKGPGDNFVHHDGVTFDLSCVVRPRPEIPAGAFWLSFGDQRRSIISQLERGTYEY